MNYFDKTFWKMTAGLGLIIILGLFGIYLVGRYGERVPASELVSPPR